jgi:2-oxoglutarate dehydrogenase E2 component (dihydrolipoamide succinyltransferase)
MLVELKVPSVGESITEGTLARWLKRDGQAVKQDEPAFELETEKATSEVVAPAAGVLKILVKEGQTVPIGTVVGQIDTAGVPTAAPAPQPAAPKKTASPTTEPTPLSPAARRLAEESGVDPKQIQGTGRGGRIIKEDVQTALEKTPTAAPAVPVIPSSPVPSSPVPLPTASSPPIATNRETRVRMSVIRQRIAKRLIESQQTTASLTTFNEADMSAITALRNKYKDKFKEKHGIGLGFLSFFVKASLEALKTYPLVNARIDGEDIVYQNFYDIGIAVSTEKGLMVPVVRGVEDLSFAEIEKGIAELATKAREGKISVSDLQGGTFTITNGGIFGSMMSTPILNPPQCAILGMHAIQKRAVVVDDQIVIRPMMYLALSYDHRLIDGREAVLFLVRIKECLEDPQRLLLEI